MTREIKELEDALEKDLPFDADFYTEHGKHRCAVWLQAARAHLTALKAGDNGEALRLFRILKNSAKMEDVHHLDGSITKEPFIHISVPLESLEFIEAALITKLVG